MSSTAEPIAIGSAELQAVPKIPALIRLAPQVPRLAAFLLSNPFLS
jgi:hypothetical protein